MAVPSESYNHGHHESVLRSHSWRTVENSAAYLAPYLTPGTTVLGRAVAPTAAAEASDGAYRRIRSLEFEVLQHKPRHFFKTFP